MFADTRVVSSLSHIFLPLCGPLSLTRLCSLSSFTALLRLLPVHSSTTPSIILLLPPPINHSHALSSFFSILFYYLPPNSLLQPLLLSFFCCLAESSDSLLMSAWFSLCLSNCHLSAPLHLKLPTLSTLHLYVPNSKLPLPLLYHHFSSLKCKQR